MSKWGVNDDMTLLSVWLRHQPQIGISTCSAACVSAVASHSSFSPLIWRATSPKGVACAHQQLLGQVRVYKPA